MNEFKKLTWRLEVTDPELDRGFLSEEAVSSLYTYKSFDNPIKPKAKKGVKLHLPTQKYVPGLKEYRPIKKRSLLTKIQKRHCLHALKLIQSAKRQDLLTQQEKYSLKIYNECHANIVEENRLFNEYVKNLWGKFKEKRGSVTKPGIYHFAWTRWKLKVNRYLEYPQFYKECGTVCLNFEENEACVDFQHVEQPLETGTLARYAQASLKEQCLLRLNTLHKIAKEAPLNSKLPVSQDENVAKLLQSHNFDVAISSSALKQLIDCTNTKTKWIIPVVITEVAVSDSASKKVVFVDKVLPTVHPNVQDLNVYTYKRLLKLQFCQYEAFSYPIKETPIEDIVASEEAENEEKTEEETKKEKVIHHNVNYRIWSIKKTTIQNTLMKNQVKDKDISLLVRCKLDACEDTEQGVLYPVIVRPKLEQQIQYGVNVPSKSELARDWTSLFFRLYSVLYRARIRPQTNEIIAIEKCQIQKINSEAHSHYDYKPILGLGVLQKILSHLTDLECGNYLLQHLPKHESFLSVMKQCDDAENAFDLHAECTDISVNSENQRNWLPIDVNYILPAHEEHNTIPGLFHGFDNYEKNNKVSKKGKKKPKKKKQK